MGKDEPVQRSRAPYVFLMPYAVAFLVFFLFPVGFSFVLSLTDWDGLHPLRSIGFANYGALLNDATFRGSMATTAIILLQTLPMQIMLALVLAFGLHMSIVGGKDFFQTVLFLPYITTPVAVGLLFQSLLGGQFGLVNALLLRVHLIREPIQWLLQPVYAKPIISFILGWRNLGYIMVFLMAGMKSIPWEIYESARVDGARLPTMFWRITVPLIRPVLSFVVVTSVIGGFQLFDEPFLLYQFASAVESAVGGPDHAGLTIVTYLYQTAYRFHHWGYAAAIGYALAIVILVCTFLGLRLLTRNRRGA